MFYGWSVALSLAAAGVLLNLWRFRAAWKDWRWAEKDWGDVVGRAVTRQDVRAAAALVMALAYILFAASVELLREDELPRLLFASLVALYALYDSVRYFIERHAAA